MFLLDNRKIIEHITDGLVSYISKLEDLKYQYTQSLNDYKRLKSLYENITYDKVLFLSLLSKSKLNKKKYFMSVIEETINDQKEINALLSEIKNSYLYIIYNNGSCNFTHFDNFINLLKERIDSLELMLNDDKVIEIENKIHEYLDFSSIFSEDSINTVCDIFSYVNIIDSLDLEDDIKIKAYELGIKEFNRLYELGIEDEYNTYNELSIDLSLDDLQEEFLDDFSFDGDLDEE